MKKSILYKVAILVVLAIAIVVSFYFYIQYQNTKKLLQNPTLVATEEAKALVAKVSILMELPTGEEPTVATVSDKSKLADQPFFMNAQNGDKVLIYSGAKKAILYRPSINKIIEVAPVNDTAVSQTPAPAAVTSLAPIPTLLPMISPVPTPVQKITKVAVYNGTKIAGLAGTTGSGLTTKVTNLNIVKTGDSVGNYTATLVVDLTGSNASVAQQIAAALGGTVGALPSGEVKPNADILVIVGK